MKLLLVLKHSDYPHVERWYKTEEGGIFVESRCPFNLPANSNHMLSFDEALAEYALLTNEGWYVDQESGWHDYVAAKRYEVVTFDKKEIIELLKEVLNVEGVDCNCGGSLPVWTCTGTCTEAKVERLLMGVHYERPETD